MKISLSLAQIFVCNYLSLYFNCVYNNIILARFRFLLQNPTRLCDNNAIWWHTCIIKSKTKSSYYIFHSYNVIDITANLYISKDKPILPLQSLYNSYNVGYKNYKIYSYTSTNMELTV